MNPDFSPETWMAFTLSDRSADGPPSAALRSRRDDAEQFIALSVGDALRTGTVRAPAGSPLHALLERVWSEGRGEVNRLAQHSAEAGC